MKICIVSPYAEPEKGAAIVRVDSLKKYLEKKGNKVKVLSPKRNNIQSTYNVFRYTNIFHLMKILISIDYDVLIGVSPPITHNFFSLIICKLKRKPMILDSKDIFTHTILKLGIMKEKSIKFILYNIIEKIVHKNSEKILVLDKNIGDWIIKKYSLEKNRIVVAPNGVDIENVRKDYSKRANIRKNLGIDKNSLLVIYMGGLGDEKYLRFLEETERVLKKKKIEILFLIASDESKSAENELNQLKLKVKKLGLDSRFHLLKNVEHSEVYKYLSAADFGLDFWENLNHFAVPVKVLEYMSCGLPVIIKIPKNNKSFKDFFEKYDVGFASNNWKEYKKKFISALSNLKLSKKKGMKGIKIIKEQFKRETTNTTIMNTLNELINN